MGRNTRDMIRDFSLAFERPVNESYTPVSIADRELLGKLLLEEVLEYCFKGLGLQLHSKDMVGWDAGNFKLTHREGVQLNPVEIVDGLADVNVVIHFNAHWHGFNLDEATEIVNDSNMSKLGPDGKPIINGVTPGYEEPVMGNAYEAGPGFDPSKPIGKILKGPNFYDPQALLSELIAREGGNRG